MSEQESLTVAQTLREIADWHRHGADFCSDTNQALKHENWAEFLESLADAKEPTTDDGQTIGNPVFGL